MRILFWSDSFWPIVGGVEVLGAQFCRALSARGYELIIVTRRDTDALADEEECFDIPVYRFPFQTALQARDLEQHFRLRHALARLKKSFKPDLIHIFHSGPGVFYHIATETAHPAPLVLTLHQTYADRLLDLTSVRGRLLRTADWVTACSHSVLAQTRVQLSQITTRSSVILNGLEMPALAPAPLPFAAPRLLCLGRVLRQKGFDLALAAFATLVQEFPRARLIIAGDGDARPDLERQAMTLGVASSVDLVGWVLPDEVPALLNSSTVVIMPSRIEPFGLVALQAAQMARPIVAARVDGLPEVVVHAKTGLLVNPEDADDLARAVRLLLMHPETATAMGRAAWQRVREVFDWDTHVSAYEAVYHGLMEGIAPGTEVAP